MTLEQIMERLQNSGMPEDIARLRATSIIASMDYDKTNTVNEIQSEIEKQQKDYNTKLQDNKRNGGLYNPELEKIQKNIDSLYKELDHELGIETYTPEPKALPAGPSEEDRLIERYQKDLEYMEIDSPMYKSTRRALDKLLAEKEKKARTEERDTLIENYQKQLETMQPGYQRDVIERTLNKLLEEKRLEEKNQEKKETSTEQAVPKFSEDTVSKLKGMVNANDLADMMKKKEETKEETGIVKYEKPSRVEDTPMKALPEGVMETKITEPKPGLIARAKNWIKNNKGKTAMIVGAAVVLGIAVVAAAHYMATGDSSVIQNATQIDPSTIHIPNPEFTTVSDIGLSNVDPSMIDPTQIQDFGSQQVDPNMFSGADQTVHFTEAHADNLTTSSDYIVDHIELTGNDGSIINADNMQNAELEEALKSGNYRDITTYHDGVGMGHHTIEDGLEKLNQVSEGGRSL